MMSSLVETVTERVKSLYIRYRTDTRNSTLQMGDGTSLNVGCEARGPVSLGKYCAIGRHVIFQGRNHIYHKPATQVSFYREMFDEELGFDASGIEVGHDVWIGNRATVLPGVTIGHGAIIGAGAVVTDDVDPYEIVGGVPAEHIDWRFGESVREQLLEIAWWDWAESKIRDNREFFQSNLSTLPEEKQVAELVQT